MAYRILWLLSLSPLLCGTGCARPSGDALLPSGYVLTIDDATSDEARYTVTVNGFPVGWGTALRGATFGGEYAPDPAYGERLADLDPALAGSDEVHVIIEPEVELTADGVSAKWLRGEFRVLALAGALGLDDTVVAGPLSLSAAFDTWLNASRPAWRGWDAPQEAELEAIVASGRQPTPEDIWIDDSVRVWIERNPLVLTASFDSRQEAVYDDRRRKNAYLFREAPVLSDTARVRAFGSRLVGLLRERDLDAARELFRPPYPGGAVRSEEEARGLDDLLIAVAAHGDLDLEPGEIGVRPWAGGRVWEVYRNDGADSAPARRGEAPEDRALLQAEVPRGPRVGPALPPDVVPPAPDMQRVWQRVYVAEVEGSLYAVWR